jgi:hypothetical protein
VRTPQRLLPLLLLALLPTLAIGCNGGDAPEAQTPTTTASADGGASGPSAEDAQKRYLVATAKKEGQIQVYKGPDESQKASTLQNPRLINDDPRAKVPLVMVVVAQADDWLSVSLPIKPNGSTGWVKASEFEVKGHDFHIEVNLGAFTIKAFEADNQVFDARIGLGTDENPTPGGTYYTTELLQPPDPNGSYGKYAYGLSGHSESKNIDPSKFGQGQLGIHGTNEPQGIGKKISHGCIRLSNDDITKLVDIGMPLGTPVVVNA